MNKHIKNSVDYNSDTKVFIYWNLTKNVWSVKALNGPSRGRVIHHLSAVTLKKCEFKVSEKQRQFILKNKRKVVHAGVVGYITDHVIDMSSSSISVTYNPYKFSNFVNKDNHNESIHSANIVHLDENRMVKPIYNKVTPILIFDKIMI